MITLYRTDEDPEGREVEQAMHDSYLAHEVVLVAASAPRSGNFLEGARPPVLVDEGEVFQGKGAILAHLEELTTLRELWHKYGSDACFCDGDGNVE